MATPWNTKRGYHCTIDLLFDWFGLVQIKTKIVSCHTANSTVKQEVNGTLMLPPLVFPAVAVIKPCAYNG